MTEQVPPTGVEDEPEHVARADASPHEAPGIEQPDPETLPRRDDAVPRTGVASVDAVLDDLERLDTLPLEEHVGAFERAHEALRTALDAAADETVAVSVMGAGSGAASSDPA